MVRAAGHARPCSHSRLASSLPLPLCPALPCLQALVVPLATRPLFPGGLMPVTVTNNALIKELFEMRKSG